MKGTEPSDLDHRGEYKCGFVYQAGQWSRMKAKAGGTGILVDTSATEE